VLGVGDLGQDTAIEGRNGTYRATLSSDWEIWGPMGGYVAAIALRAAAAEVPPELEPASFTCQFLAPARFEPVDIDVRVRRISRRAAAVAVSVTQNDKPILDAQSWFALPSEVITHDYAAPHPYGHPDDYRFITELTDEAAIFPFWNNFEGKPTEWIDDWDSYAGGPPEWSEWVKFIPAAGFADPVLEAARLVLLADLPSFPAAIRAHPGPRTFVSPSLDLAVQLHRLDDIGDWLLVQGTAPIAERGLLGFRSEVWDTNNRLLASGSGQLLARTVAPES
jgi:acyl-CoA thioesterase II